MWPLKTKKKSRQKRKEIGGRRQFNFSCDKDLAQRLKNLARFLETPLYPVTEHLIEVGINALNKEIEDKSLRQELKRHIIQKHLLGKRLCSEEHILDNVQVRGGKEND